MKLKWFVCHQIRKIKAKKTGQFSVFWSKMSLSVKLSRFRLYPISSLNSFLNFCREFNPLHILVKKLKKKLLDSLAYKKNSPWFKSTDGVEIRCFVERLFQVNKIALIDMIRSKIWQKYGWKISKYWTGKLDHQNFSHCGKIEDCFGHERLFVFICICALNVHFIALMQAKHSFC